MRAPVSSRELELRWAGSPTRNPTSWATLSSLHHVVLTEQGFHLLHRIFSFGFFGYVEMVVHIFNTIKTWTILLAEMTLNITTKGMIQGAINSQSMPIFIVDAIPFGILTTGFAEHRLRIIRDPTRHDGPIQGRISQDYAKTPTGARLLSLADKLIPDINS